MPTITEYQAVVWCPDHEKGETGVCMDGSKYPAEEIYEGEVPESVARFWLGDKYRADDHEDGDYRIITVYYNEETGECT